MWTNYRQHALIRWCAALLLASGVVFRKLSANRLGAYHAFGLSVVLPEASQTLRAYPLALTVRVRDTAGQPWMKSWCIFTSP